MKEVMLKIISPGKDERARALAKVPVVVGDVGFGEDLFELSANLSSGAMGIKMVLMCLKANIIIKLVSNRKPYTRQFQNTPRTQHRRCLIANVSTKDREGP